MSTICMPLSTSRKNSVQWTVDSGHEEINRWKIKVVSKIDLNNDNGINGDVLDEIRKFRKLQFQGSFFTEEVKGTEYTNKKTIKDDTSK